MAINLLPLTMVLDYRQSKHQIHKSLKNPQYFNKYAQTVSSLNETKNVDHSIAFKYPNDQHNVPLNKTKIVDYSIAQKFSNNSFLIK